MRYEPAYVTGVAPVPVRQAQWQRWQMQQKVAESERKLYTYHIPLGGVLGLMTYFLMQGASREDGVIKNLAATVDLHHRLKAEVHNLLSFQDLPPKVKADLFTFNMDVMGGNSPPDIVRSLRGLLASAGDTGRMAEFKRLGEEYVQRMGRIVENKPGLRKLAGEEAIRRLMNVGPYYAARLADRDPQEFLRLMFERIVNGVDPAVMKRVFSRLGKAIHQTAGLVGGAVAVAFGGFYLMKHQVLKKAASEHL